MFQMLMRLTWNGNQRCKTISVYETRLQWALSEYEKVPSRSKKAQIAIKLKEHEAMEIWAFPNANLWLKRHLLEEPLYMPVNNMSVTLMMSQFDQSF